MRRNSLKKRPTHSILDTKYSRRTTETSSKKTPTPYYKRAIVKKVSNRTRT